MLVGLGNPGAAYAQTRHNIGADYLLHLAQQLRAQFQNESRFKAQIARVVLADEDVRLVLPTTYMNLSGQAVGALAHFYKLQPPQILVAHDEMAFAPGQFRLKQGGGANGHNGLISIIEALGMQQDFLRLRIGVGHPGDRSKVTAYLTSQRLPAAERELIEAGFAAVDAQLPLLVAGELGKAMNQLHAQDQS